MTIDSNNVSIWGYDDGEDLCSVMVQTRTVERLAGLFDPIGPDIYLESSTDLDGWAGAAVPLTSGELKKPATVLLKSLSYRLMISPAAFLERAASIGKDGLFAAQVAKTPPFNEWRDFEDMPHAARVWWLRACDALIVVSLPYAGGAAQVTARSPAQREAALARLTAERPSDF